MINLEQTKLILLTSRYPYKPGEEFIEAELEYVSKQFDEIHIIPVNFIPDVKTKRAVPSNVKIHLFDELTKKKNSRTYLNNLIAGLGSLTRLKWLIKELIYSLKFGARGAIKAVQWFILGCVTEKYLTKVYNEVTATENTNIVVYSYWLTPAAIATSILKERKPKISAVARAHGGDLYEYRHNLKYLPFKGKVLNALDRVFTISNDGKRYLSSQFPEQRHKIKTSRLGTKAVLKKNPPINDGTFRIISCSYLKDVKRVHIIIEALSKMTIPVEWTHIGDGPLRGELERGIEQLPLNIKVHLLGNLTNEKVILTYKDNDFDVFVNVSESEGIPVTFMEAFSCGIPIIATNVGGVPEIVNEQNGILLPKDLVAEDLKKAFISFIHLSDEEKLNMRESAFIKWQMEYSAETNYTLFSNEIKGIEGIMSNE